VHQVQHTNQIPEVAESPSSALIGTALPKSPSSMAGLVLLLTQRTLKILANRLKDIREESALSRFDHD
jgi:hypothetical protein